MKEGIETPKELFVREYVATLQKYGVEVDGRIAWDIFCLGIATGVDLCREKPLSLSGLVKFEILISGRSGKPKTRIRPGSNVDSIVEAKESFRERIMGSVKGIAKPGIAKPEVSNPGIAKPGIAKPEVSKLLEEGFEL